MKRIFYTLVFSLIGTFAYSQFEINNLNNILKLYSDSSATFTSGVYIKADGSVGIGTTNPATPLHITGTGNQRITVASSDSQAGIGIKSDNDGEWIMYSPDGTNDLRFYEADATADQITFQDGGNVGIGITSPAVKLDIDPNSNTEGIRLRGLAETVELADIYVGANGNLVLDATPGTGSAAFIDIRPEDDNYGLVLRESDGTGIDPYANFYVTDNGTDDYLTIGVNSVQDQDALVIDENDQVGIGINPSSGDKLSVYGSAKVGYTGGTTHTERLTLSGRRTGNGASVFEIDFENDDVTTYDMASIESWNAGGTDDGMLRFVTANNAVATNVMDMEEDGQIQLHQYGSGNFTGADAYWLAVDASGNIIEEAAPAGGGGSGLPALNITAEKTTAYTAADEELVLVGSTGVTGFLITSPTYVDGNRFGVLIQGQMTSDVTVALDNGSTFDGTDPDTVNLGTDRGLYIFEAHNSRYMRTTNFVDTYDAYGDTTYTATGSHTWYPADYGLKVGDIVTVVAVGGGGSGGRSTSPDGGGGAGGALGYGQYKITSSDMTSGISVVVGAGGASLNTSTTGNGNAGGQSYFGSATTIQAGGGAGGVINGTATGGTYNVTNAVGAKGGGNGGNGGGGTNDGGGGGGAGGYSGNGGAGGGDTNAAGSNGSGGGGGGGAWTDASGEAAGGGGGVGIWGEGTSGTGGATQGAAGTGGSGGTDGASGSGGGTNVPDGGLYGGGGGFADDYFSGEEESGAGGNGAVRIVWGADRAFPTTDVDSIGTGAVAIEYTVGDDQGSDQSFGPTNTTLTNSNITWEVKAGYNYAVNCYIDYVTATAPDAKWIFVVPSGTTGTYDWEETDGSNVVLNSNWDTEQNSTSTGTIIGVIRGTMFVTTSGTVTFQMAQRVSDADTGPTLRLKSHCICSQMY